MKKSCDSEYPYACNGLSKIFYQYKYNDEAAQYYKKTCELVNVKYFQETCDMYELLKTQVTFALGLNLLNLNFTPLLCS